MINVYAGYISITKLMTRSICTSILKIWRIFFFVLIYDFLVIIKAMEKKEIINSIKRDFVQNHTFYAKKRYFLQKVRNAVQKSIEVEKIEKKMENYSNMCFTADLYSLEK